ncbi:hypothetical protein D3C85_1133560 [compost metagenome]
MLDGPVECCVGPAGERFKPHSVIFEWEVRLSVSQDGLHRFAILGHNRKDHAQTVSLALVGIVGSIEAFIITFL